MKKEIPVLFNTSMVKAQLDGQKTMTRRIVKSTQHGWNCQNMDFTHSENILTSEITQKYKRQASQLVGVHAFFTDKEYMGHQLGIKCPLGQPGDMLWVRETWMYNPNIEMFPNEPYYFKASKSKQFIEEWPKCWRPSIHMPKEAARIWLQVEEVRVERLHSITKEDAIAEGIEKMNDQLFKSYAAENMWTNVAKDSFMTLWSKINGVKSTHANPWVWVVKFKVVSTTGRNAIIENQGA